MNTNPFTIIKGVPLAVSILQSKLNELKTLSLVIAIDGHSSSGKSTLAGDLARLLDLRHLDSGAMYRAVTLHMLDHHIDIHNEVQLERALEDITIDLKLTNEGRKTYLNGRDVESEIRSMRVANYVSEVSTVSRIREFLVKQQQQMGADKKVVMDGRDIGTVVFPNADIKFFITASMEVRCHRRLLELKAKGLETSADAVCENIKKRDLIDSTRKDSPLKQAKDAIVLDTSKYDRTNQLQAALEVLLKKFLIKSD